MKWQRVLFIISTLCLLNFYSFSPQVSAQEVNPLVLEPNTDNKSIYPAMEIIKDYDLALTIEDVYKGPANELFIPSEEVEQSPGFFQAGNWLRFEIENDSDSSNWVLEFSFALIHQLDLYEEVDGEIHQLYKGGADYPFHHRPVNHRYFIYDLPIEPGEKKTFYAFAVGSGDLHPPISVWRKSAFLEKTQIEASILGVFYGIALVMISYNLFLYFSLRMRSYLYYVLTITFTLLGKMSINGTGFQYLWPNAPEWNIVSASVWVALGCISIILFTRNFIDVNRFAPSFKKTSYVLIGLNMIVLLSIPFFRYLPLYLMVTSALITFGFVLTYAVISLVRGAREARFYIVGWIIFLTGISITLLERAVILPFNIVTEYAGQAALTMETVLLSLALADKINIMRREKEQAVIESERSKEEAIKNLQKADELKDEFLAVTSHELRTPLYGMIGIAQSLKDGATGELSDGVKKQLNLIVSSGERLTHIVNEILDLSKLKYDSIHLEVKPVKIDQVVEVVIAVTLPLLEKKPIQLINKVSSDLPPVQADANRLQQILHNLIDNAIKYTDEGTITISAFEKNNEITISVSDTGRGISEKELDNIFLPFEQTSSSVSRDKAGVGIGLSITKNLTELHNGTIAVSSEEGIGSTFSITLPVYDEIINEGDIDTNFEIMTQREEVEEVLPTQTFHDKQAKILVADDEFVNLQVLMNQLTLEGYEVITVSRGDDVFEVVEKQDIDLIILDIMMPGMSGYDVCKKLRENFSLMELPILMLTAKNQLQDKVISFEAGANDYLVKPTDKQELLSRVKTLVRVKVLNQEIMQFNIQLEEKVAKRTKDLKQANIKLQEVIASRQQLLASIAHELGTPVTLIHNYLELVSKQVVDVSDPYYQSLVNEKMNMLNRLIEDLYDLSLLESKQFSFNLEEKPLSEWLNNVFEMCEFEIEKKGRSFSMTYSTEEAKDYICFVDSDRMNQLLQNLISNAIKNTDANAGKISLTVSVKESFVYLEVADNGFGIKKENLPYIFERFFKRDVESQEHEGTGLGLAIVKQIVEGHRGAIEVESEENVGTTFYIKLPLIHKTEMQI